MGREEETENGGGMKGDSQLTNRRGGGETQLSDRGSVKRGEKREKQEIRRRSEESAEMNFLLSVN